MSKFQAIVLGICVVCGVGGLIMFSVFKGKGSQQEVRVSMWGVVSRDQINPFTENLIKTSGSKITINYTQIRPQDFYGSYVEALASGQGPDLLLLAQDQYLQFASKTYQIPYKSLSQTTYKAAYLPVSDVYLTSQGIGAIPFSIDPMVMYWNKDIFINALITTPPQYWSDIPDVAEKLTIRDAAYNITTSGVSLGEYANIDHAKDIISLLLLDSGSPITAYNQGSLKNALSQGFSKKTNAQSALDFYTQFANPTKNIYSWSKGLPTSKNYFTSNKLGMYFGYASEFQEITNKNPNLNFDVALMPQMNITIAGQPLHQTYGRLYGISIAKSSRNSAGALQAALLLGSQTASQLWSKMTHLPPIRNDAITNTSNDAVQGVFVRSALWAKTWYDPNAAMTDKVFKTTIENITSGRLSVSQSLTQAREDLDTILP